ITSSLVIRFLSLSQIGGQPEINLSIPRQTTSSYLLAVRLAFFMPNMARFPGFCLLFFDAMIGCWLKVIPPPPQLPIPEWHDKCVLWPLTRSANLTEVAGL